MASFYRLVEQAIPDVELVYGRPAVHSDGSLEFSGPPPMLMGYRKEGQRLHPDWPPCGLRMLRVQIVDSVLTIEGVCGSPAAGHFSYEVTLDQCQNCATRQS